MKISELKDARVDFRLTSEQKEIISRAASLSGLSLSDFISTTILKASNQILENHSQVITLPYEAWEKFTQAIKSDADEPTDAAKKAAEDYNRGQISGDKYQW